ncbi:MAG: hypothetical protein CV089_02335 [Nitrospira sp. WS110]|nr:hypothetical protein [Nitrospira sp. WS110]
MHYEDYIVIYPKRFRRNTAARVRYPFSKPLPPGFAVDHLYTGLTGYPYAVLIPLWNESYGRGVPAYWPEVSKPLEKLFAGVTCAGHMDNTPT